jgi:hypothetical protein
MTIWIFVDKTLPELDPPPGITSPPVVNKEPSHNIPLSNGFYFSFYDPLKEKKSTT